MTKPLMKLLLTIFIFSLLSLNIKAQIIYKSDELKLEINNHGFVTGLVNVKQNHNYLRQDTITNLMLLVSDGKRFAPSSVKKSGNVIQLLFAEKNVKIEIKCTEKSTHLVFEIVKATPVEKIEAVVWGPFAITINKIVGEVIGVSRDEKIAVGMQVLNIKTLGGDYPNNEGSTWSRGIAAVSKPWGSLLQAYSINRDLARHVDAWGGVYKNMLVAPIKGESVVGSKIALFSCEEPKTLDRLEQIELAENLPHPTIKGTWFKKSELFGKSYLISSFSESEVDEMVSYTKRSGLVSLYHEGPFKSWGHFVLDEKQFPNGIKGLKHCADKAHAAGLMLGVHTLSNFTNTNDPYVSPIPDDRLSFTGSSTLKREIDATAKEIEVASPEYFNQKENNNLHAVKIGKEIIRYNSVSETPPYILMDCQRGAFGTAATSHKTGDEAKKLFDHAYNVFFPDINMQRETSKNIANLLNETGVDHWDFDGLEGGWASGQGDYGIELLAKDVHDNLKHDFFCGTSVSKTFFWHMCSYYNWGEPWYGGFKESMQQYRIDNQGLFERNYMPHMLGWYLLTSTTTLPDMEWMLARAAGYNAGFAMVARPKDLRKNPLTPALLDAIREWELARNTHAFNDAQRAALQIPSFEFHLEKLSEKKWKLYQYAASATFVKERIIRQPGEPTYSTYNYEQTWSIQPLQFQLTVSTGEGTVSALKLQFDNYADVDIPAELIAGDVVVCDGTKELKILSSNGSLRQQIKLASELPLLKPGMHSMKFDGLFEGNNPSKVEIRLKGLMSSEEVLAKR
jgi:hypothetical protein